MFAENWSKVVVASVAPVVVISASGLLCLAFYNRLAAIVSRLRAVQRERLSEMSTYQTALKKGGSAAIEKNRRFLTNLGHQTARIIVRARLIRLTLRCLLTAIGLMIVTSLLNGAALFWAPISIASAIAFVLGMLSLLIGIMTAMRELASSLDVVELETQLVSDLTDYEGDQTDESDDDIEVFAK